MLPAGFCGFSSQISLQNIEPVDNRWGTPVPKQKKDLHIGFSRAQRKSLKLDLKGKGIKRGLLEISLGVAHQGLYHFLQLPERRLQPGGCQHLLTDNKGKVEMKVERYESKQSEVAIEV